METTEKYGLKKPEPTDFYSVEDFNDNADMIDAKFKEHDAKFKEYDAKLEGKTDKTADIYSNRFSQILASGEKLYVVSESADDTVYCKNRGFKRASSEKVIIGRTTTGSGYNGYLGYYLIGASEEALATTSEVDEYSGLNIYSTTTPMGNTVYFGCMKGMYQGTNPVVATVDGEVYEISVLTLASSKGIETSNMAKWILGIADMELFSDLCPADPNNTKFDELAKLSTSKLSLSGGAMTGTLEAQNVNPKTAGTYVCGSADKPWANVMTRALNLYDSAKIAIGFLGSIIQGTASVIGENRLQLGNNTPSGTAGNAWGRILMYNQSDKAHWVQPNNNITGTVTSTLPLTSGTLANTSDVAAVKVSCANFTASSATSIAATDVATINISCTQTGKTPIMAVCTDTGSYLCHCYFCKVDASTNVVTVKLKNTATASSTSVTPSVRVLYLPS